MHSFAPASKKIFTAEEKAARSARRNSKALVTLSNFDSLPDSAYVRQPVVEVLYACSPATIWRWIKSGRIPPPKRLGERVTAWLVGDLRRSLGGI